MSADHAFVIPVNIDDTGELPGRRASETKEPAAPKTAGPRDGLKMAGVIVGILAAFFLGAALWREVITQAEDHAAANLWRVGIFLATCTVILVAWYCLQRHVGDAQDALTTLTERVLRHTDKNAIRMELLQQAQREMHRAMLEKLTAIQTSFAGQLAAVNARAERDRTKAAEDRATVVDLRQDVDDLLQKVRAMSEYDARIAAGPGRANGHSNVRSLPGTGES